MHSEDADYHPHGLIFFTMKLSMILFNSFFNGTLLLLLHMVSGTFSRDTIPKLCWGIGKQGDKSRSWNTTPVDKGTSQESKALRLLKQPSFDKGVNHPWKMLRVHRYDPRASTGYSRMCALFTPTENTYSGLHTQFPVVQRKGRAQAARRALKRPIEIKRIVELVVVIVYTLFMKLTFSRRSVQQHCLNLVNFVNTLYAPLNISIALIGVIVWSTHNQIYVSSNSSRTLDEFLRYRRQYLLQIYPHDHAVLLTAVEFQHGVVGKAYPYSMCTYEHSGSAINDDIQNEELVAVTIAHELGHSFGMHHDTGCCPCAHCCIMGASLSSKIPTMWTPCNLRELDYSLRQHIDLCLRDRPATLFFGPICGNKLLEQGEECDTDNFCCNASTCLLFQNASCATGVCCNLKTCRPKNQGTLCRVPTSECDLPDYCDGTSATCPDDIYKLDGTPCKRGRAFCYHGSCKTRTDQCRKLWGSSARSLDDQCYGNNDRGSINGNCGYDFLSNHYTRCNVRDLHCGILQCGHRNSELEFGIHRYAKIGNTLNYTTNDKCSTAVIDLGLQVIQPGLVPNGAKCGTAKWCINQTCVLVNNNKNQTCHCNGHGICTNKNRCFCEVGYEPPFCTKSIPVTTISSKPSTENPQMSSNAHTTVKITFYTILLGILPIILITVMVTNFIKRIYMS